MNRRRLEQLERRREERTPRAAHEAVDGEKAKELWLRRAKARRLEAHSTEEFHAGDVFRLLRAQGNLPGTAEKLCARLFAWRPPLDPRAVERVVARLIYHRAEGTEGMECPPEWREAFEAAEELLGLYMDAPPEDLARIYVAARDIEEGEGDDRLEERLDEEMDRLGITIDLVGDAVGPDGGEIPEQEVDRRLREALGDFYYGERGYEVQQHITRLVNEERS